MRQPLPSYARWPRVLGILSFILFLFLGVTGTHAGVLLPADGRRTPTARRRRSRATSRFGCIVHQVHRWASILFLIVLVMRVLRFFFGGLYGEGTRDWCGWSPS